MPSGLLERARLTSVSPSLEQRLRAVLEQLFVPVRKPVDKGTAMPLLITAPLSRVRSPLAGSVLSAEALGSASPSSGER